VPRAVRPTYTAAQVSALLERDLIPQKLVRYLLGRAQVIALESSGSLKRVVTGHRTALYSTAQFLNLRSAIAEGKIRIIRTGLQQTKVKSTKK
jgi:hypothetical protein